VNDDLASGVRWVASTFVENIEATNAVYRCAETLDPVTEVSVCSTLQRGDTSLVDQLVSAGAFSVIQVDEEARAMILNQIPASILEFFVKENPHSRGLYIKKRSAGVRLEMEGLPDVQYPEVGKLQKHLPNGMSNCAMELDLGTLNLRTATDLKVQSMLYIENLLQMGFHQPVYQLLRQRHQYCMGDLKRPNVGAVSSLAFSKSTKCTLQFQSSTISEQTSYDSVSITFSTSVIN